MWEIVSRAVPYEDSQFEWIDEVSRAVRSGTRPTRTHLVERSRQDFTTLMTECWAGDPDDRPGFAEIVQRLNLMLPVSERKIQDNSAEIESTV